MMRQSDTSRWDNPWYSALEPRYKLAWMLVVDRAYEHGEFTPGQEADDDIGTPIDWDALHQLARKMLCVMPTGNWVVVGMPTSKDASPKKRAAKKKMVRPTPDEINAYLLEIGVPHGDGQTLWDKWEGNGWKNGGNPIKSWKATIRQWNRQGYLPSSEAGKMTIGTTPTPRMKIG